MRVVIDTNVLIGGSYDESSYAFKIIREVIDGRIEAFATHQTMSENRQMLRKLVRDREYRELLEEFFRRLKITPSFFPLHKGEVGRGLVSDPEDIKLFQSTMASNADYLITEDREVLDVGEYDGTKVVTPEDFWVKYQNGRDDDSQWQSWTRMVMGR